MTAYRSCPRRPCRRTYAETYETFARNYGPFRNQAAVLAHVPPALDHLSNLLMELKARQGIKWRYVELAIVVVSKLNACAYCVSHHEPKLHVEGLSQAAVEHAAGSSIIPEFDERRSAGHRVFGACHARARTHSGGRVPTPAGAFHGCADRRADPASSPCAAPTIALTRSAADRQRAGRPMGMALAAAE